MNPLNLQSARAKKARLARSIGKAGKDVLIGGIIVFALGAIWLFVQKNSVAYIVVAVALACFIFLEWYLMDLKKLPVTGESLEQKMSGDALALLPQKQQLTPRIVWDAYENYWQTIFLMNHLLLPTDVKNFFGTEEAQMAPAWEQAQKLAQNDRVKTLEPGHIVTAILLTTPQLEPFFKHVKLLPEDMVSLVQWLDRIVGIQRQDKPFFGGIGRDWTSGYTPVLDNFGQNLSHYVEGGGAHFESLLDSAGVQAMHNSFNEGAFAISLIGQEGIGKTTSVYALAQLMMEGKAGPKLKYNQIIALNPSVIMSSAQGPGQLEQIVLTLLNESVKAGHIILFLDDAQLFFGEGPGSFDATQILLPVMQSGRVRLILAMNPSDWQRLKAKNASFANLTTPVVLQEPDQATVMRVLQDKAMALEPKHNVLITHDSMREAYRLSGRYNTDNAYPGRAIQLLTQSLPHAKNGVLTAVSVQDAIEQTSGVKVGDASAAEADTLLHLEDQIHKRMINQSHAVKVVSAALRRARAGVSSPKRPIGSFLFLGPTGVGKTELSKAIATTYFGDESKMVRLDMSEYQQPEDVKRLLSDGKEDNMSLLLAVRQQPFTVVLLDEIEKSHPNILNLLLQLLDEGDLTDTSGRQVSFKDCIIICTSNAGADTIRQKIEQGEELAEFEKQFTDQLINSGQFKPELLNRFDEIVLFRPLKPEELMQVVKLMMDGINETLKNQNISVELTDAATMKIVQEGNDPRLGARPMRRMLQRAVEDTISTRILSGALQPGDHATLDAPDLNA
jgi:ATP-dependent Clp protease ATP-binding subunit ClpC